MDGVKHDRVHVVLQQPDGSAIVLKNATMTQHGGTMTFQAHADEEWHAGGEWYFDTMTAEQREEMAQLVAQDVPEDWARTWAVQS